MDDHEVPLTGSGGALTIGVLGPFALAVDGHPVELTTGRLRTLLAVLAMSAGKTVSMDRLATALWEHDPPSNARRSVQTYLARLRSAFGIGPTISTEPTGYRLQVDPDRVDALRFARLLDDAAVTPDPPTRRALLEQALSLWRGTPFTGIQSIWLERTEAPWLLERYLAAVERRIDLDLAEDRHGELVAPLRELTGEHPLRESLWVRLLIALDRCGRLAEALEQYQTIRVRLADELGTDPGPELQRIHADLLAGNAPPRPEPAATGRTVPRELPAGIAGFTGRADALKALDDLISEGDGRIAGAVVISAIAGTAGVGKTALAIHWAHQVADRFPDGQLYVNLRGYHPSGQAVAPAEAVRGFLEALGVPPQRIPTDPDAQAGLYRSLLAGRRMLVMLDNARDADQVRPLLPGSPGCLVVVTSRSQLTSLIATVAAHPLILDLLPVDEARELLAHRLGADRVATEPAAVDEIITYCAGLPLALAIVAARVAAHPTFPLQGVVTQMQHTQPRLDAFVGGDLVTDVRAVFSWSYQGLSSQAARLFRLLSLHPGPDIAAPAAASLAGLPGVQVRPLLAELTRAHLIVEHTPGRRTLHDLLRAYTTELTHTHDTEAVRSAARHRMLDHYLHTAHAAAMLLSPHRPPIALAPPQPGAAPEHLSDHEQAMNWFAAEHTVLPGTIAQAVDAGLDTHAWQLAWTLQGALYRRGLWREWAAMQQLALDAARRLDEPAARAEAHRGLGGAYTWLGRYQEAYTQLRNALDLFEQLGDIERQTRTHLDLVQVLGRQEHHADALYNSQRVLELSRASGDRKGEASALNLVGWENAQLGNYQQALIHCQQALALFQEIGNLDGTATTLDSLGYAHHHLGRYEQAISCYQQAISIFRELGDRYATADTLTNLGGTHLAAGDREASRSAWQEALTILNDLDHPDADQLHAKLQRASSDVS